VLQYFKLICLHVDWSGNQQALLQGQSINLVCRFRQHKKLPRKIPFLDNLTRQARVFVIFQWGLHLVSLLEVPAYQYDHKTLHHLNDQFRVENK